jgi:2-methylisocitrate lyase-like PEP mutase family enzyme
VTRDEALVNARMIVEATDLPVSADLEKCFGDAASMVAETIRLAAGVGLVGGSVEDATGDSAHPLYDIGQDTERVAAAVAAARALPYSFMLTARTESFLRSNPDLDDVIKRLQAFEKVGADVLMAPGLPDLAAVRAVCSAVSKPVNFMAGIKGKSFTVVELEAAGVRRISLAIALSHRDDGPCRGRPRDKEQRHLRLHCSLDSDTRSGDLHAGLTATGWLEDLGKRECCRRRQH